MMIKIIITVLRYILLAAVIMFGSWYVITNYERFASGAHFTWFNISVLVGLNLLTILCESIRLKIMVDKLKYNLSLLHSWHIISVIQAVNHMILKAGTLSGGYYLSKKYKISFHDYIAFIVTYPVMMVLSSCIFGLFTTLLFIILGLSVDLFILLFFTAIILFSTGFIGIASIHIPLNYLPKFTRRFFTSWKEIYSDYQLLFTLMVVELFYFLTCSLRFMTAVSMFSGDVRFLDSVVVVTVGNFLRLASIVPGGIGVAEVASGWTAGLLGKDVGLAGLSAGLDRVVYVVLIMIFGAIGFFTLSGRSEFHKPSEKDKDLMHEVVS